MKVLMENWRKFVSEAEDKKPIDLPSDDNIVLYHDKDIDNHELVIYRMDKYGPFVIAGCTIDVISETDAPCIPETWQMSTIYTHGNYRGEGYSKLLYGLAFYLVNKDGAGLTSDHWTSTSKSAKDRSWNKLISRGQVVPRKTPGTPPFGGHSEFDYGNKDGTRKTPDDPLDDCEEPSEGPAATDSSLVLKNYTKFEPIYLKLTQRHEDVMSAVPDRKQVEKQLIDDNSNNFDKFYGG